MRFAVSLMASQSGNSSTARAGVAAASAHNEAMISVLNLLMMLPLLAPSDGFETNGRGSWRQQASPSPQSAAGSASAEGSRSVYAGAGPNTRTAFRPPKAKELDMA